MALFTSNLAKPIMWDSFTKAEGKNNAQKIIDPVQIDFKQFSEIHENNMKSEEFRRYYSDMLETKKRFERAQKDAKKALDEYDTWADKLECFPLLQKAKDSGVQLTGRDKEIFDMKEVGLQKKVDELKKIDDTRNKEKDKLRERWVTADKLWKEFSLTMLGQPFAFESEGKYFRIGGGVLHLKQKSKKDKDEMGSEFREFLLDKEKITKMTYAEIVNLLYRYEKACDLGTHDRGQVAEVLNFVRDNPKCSRNEFLDEAIKIADPEFRHELNVFVLRLKKNKDFEADLENSIDPVTERDQILFQERADFQKDEKMKKKLSNVREHLSEAERIRNSCKSRRTLESKP